MEISDWIALAAVFMAFLALVMSALLYDLNRRMADANETMAEANTDMATATKDAVEIARNLASIEETKHRDSLKARLTFVSQKENSLLYGPGETELEWKDTFLLLRFRNEGSHPAYDVHVTMGGHLIAGLSDDGRPHTMILPGETKTLQSSFLRWHDGTWIEVMNGNGETRSFENTDPLEMEHELLKMGPFLLHFRDGLGTEAMRFLLRAVHFRSKNETGLYINNNENLSLREQYLHSDR